MGFRLVNAFCHSVVCPHVSPSEKSVVFLGETNFQEKQLTEYGGETVHTLGKLDRVIAMGQKRTLLM